MTILPLLHLTFFSGQGKGRSRTEKPPTLLQLTQRPLPEPHGGSGRQAGGADDLPVGVARPASGRVATPTPAPASILLSPIFLLAAAAVKAVAVVKSAAAARKGARRRPLPQPQPTYCPHSSTHDEQ